MCSRTRRSNTATTPARYPRSGENAARNCHAHQPARRRARPSRQPATSACPCHAATAASRRRRNRQRLRPPCAASDPPAGRTAPSPASPARQVATVLDPQPPLLRVFTMNRPPSDHRPGRREVAALLLDDDGALAGVAVRLPRPALPAHRRRRSHPPVRPWFSSKPQVFARALAQPSTLCRCGARLPKVTLGPRLPSTMVAA